MSTMRYQALGPLLSGEGSRAFIGLEVSPDGRATPVVLVWVPEEANKDANLLERIRRETEHAAKLDHPHIVRVHGFASLDEGHARVVEFADGESLRKILDVAKKLPVSIAARIVVDAAMGTHYAHVAGNDDGTPLVHGDVRPETLLISFSGITKVTGYGALQFAPREMGGLRVRGRRIHTAPEQIIGGRDAVTLPTDVYLLGLTLLECLIGEVPYLQEPDFDEAVLTRPLPSLPPEAVPEKLAAVIQKACAKRAPERYANPLALKEAIEQAVGNIASHEELSTYLKSLFPDSDAARAARRQAIDAGIADFVRRQWAERTPPLSAAATSVPAPVAMPVPVSIPSPVVIATPVAPQPAKRAAAPRQITPEARDPQAKSNAGWFMLAGTLVACIGLWWGISASRAPVFPTGSADASTALPIGFAVISDAGSTATAAVEVAARDASSEPDADDDLAPLVNKGPTVADAGSSPPVPVLTEAILELDVDPDVEVMEDGKLIAKTPLKRTFKPGRHVFQFVNKALGITTSRTYNLDPGEHAKDDVKLGKGIVIISAPEGATIFIDGIHRGKAPVKELTVYEGNHRLLVTVGKAKWTQAFSLYEGQRISYDVEMQ
jgi:serine/threonine-protein kinase